MNHPAIQQLNKELDALREFEALLLSEQAALINNDTDSLLTLSESKTLAANKLSEMAKKRRETLLTGDIDTMEAWFAKHAPGSIAVWHDIRKQAAEIQHLNNTNGEMINAKMRSNQQALNTLFSSSKNAANLYGPDGQTNINSSGRHLGSG